MCSEAHDSGLQCTQNLEEGRREQEQLMALGGKRNVILFLELYYLFRILELITTFYCVIKKFVLNIGPVKSLYL